MLRRFLFAPLLALYFFLTGCAGVPVGEALSAANAIAGGVACGVAASQGTPCTPTELLTQLAEAQKALIQIAASQVRDADPAVVEALLRGLEASAATQRALAEQVIRLAERSGPAAAPPKKEEPPPAPAPSPPPAVLPAPAPPTKPATSGAEDVSGDG